MKVLYTNKTTRKTQILTGMSIVAIAEWAVFPSYPDNRIQDPINFLLIPLLSIISHFLTILSIRMQIDF